MNDEQKHTDWRDTRNWGFDFWNQWREVLHWPEWNWCNFALFSLETEFAGSGGYKGAYFEVTLIVLGFAVRFEVFGRESRKVALAPFEARRKDWLERNPTGDTNV